jgi:hypothetical protein
LIAVELGNTGVSFVKLGGLPKSGCALGHIVFDSVQQFELPKYDHPSADRHGQQGNRHKADDPVSFLPKAQ